MPVKMHFRTDGWHWADLKTYGWTVEKFKTERMYGDEPETLVEFEATPIAQPGDIWRMHWYKDGGDGPICGYAICCPKCGHVHCWNTAGNCQFNLTEHSYKDLNGVEKTYKVCGHNGVSSCWDWTGSAEENTLTAKPSLLVTVECGFHGWLENGELRSC